MRRILRNLKFDQAEFVSLVDLGASGDGVKHRPRIVLAKRRETGKMTMKQRIAKMLASLRKAEESSEDAAKATPQEMLDSALVGLPEDKQQAILEAVALLLDQEMSEPAAEDVEEGEGEGEGAEKAAKPKPKPATKPKPKPEPEPEEEEPAPELEKSRDDLKKAQERIEALEVEAKKRKALEKARETPFVPGVTAEDLALLLADAGALPEKSRKVLDKALKATNEAVKRSDLLAEYGTGGRGGGSSANEKIQNLAKERRAEMAKANKNVTQAQAVAAILKEKPELYKEYRLEQAEGAVS